MSSAWYNIIVVGDDLCGLIYAAIAARHGYRVGVVGHGAKPSVYRHDGHLFMRRRELLYSLGTSPVVGQALSDLSLNLALKNRPEALDPPFQVVLPGMRLDAARDPARWEAELGRELGPAADQLKRFDHWAAEATRRSHDAVRAEMLLPPEGMRAQGRYRSVCGGIRDLVPEGRDSADMLRELRASPTLRTLVEAPTSLVSGLAERPLPALVVARLWTHLRAGIFRIPDGLDGLKAMLVRKLRDQCGDYRPDDVVEEVDVRRGRARGVKLAARGGTLGCELIVGNMEPRHFLGLIPPERRIDRFHTQINGLEPSAYRVTINLAVNPGIIPLGMAPELVLVGNPRAPLEGANCLWLTRPYDPRGREGRPGDEVLTVTTNLPARGLSPSPKQLKLLMREVLVRLEELIPWLGKHVTCVHTPALHTDPATGQLAVDTHALEPILDRSLAMTLGLSGIACGTAYRNVLLAGDALFGGLAFEGAAIGARQALALTRRTLKLRSALS